MKDHTILWRSQPWLGSSSPIESVVTTKDGVQNMMHGFHTNGVGYLYAGSVKGLEDRLKLTEAQLFNAKTGGTK